MMDNGWVKGRKVLGIDGLEGFVSFWALALCFYGYEGRTDHHLLVYLCSSRSVQKEK